LERMALDADRLCKYLDALMERDHVSEAVIVSTCNRTEIYVAAERFHGAYQDVQELVSNLTYLPPEGFADHLEVAWDADAVRHLFRVSAGLDSVVVGEHEILGQVRAAWDAAREQGAAGPVLNLLFRHALECGKRARTETSISRSITSVSQAAVVMASERLGGLDGRSALVVGAGAMGGGMAHLLAKAGAGAVTVANRSMERGSLVGSKSGAAVVGLDRLADALVDVDLMCTATSSNSPVVTAELVASVMVRRAGRHLVIVDVAMPRDVAPEVGELDGVDLLDMTHLQAFCDRGIADRRSEVPAVEQIVVEELDRWSAQSSSRIVAPLVSSMFAGAERVRRSEVDRLSSRLADLDPGQREAVEALTRGIVAKLLHEPTIRLKDAAGTPRGDRLAASVRDLFDLD